jgi:hypothetical protein
VTVKRTAAPSLVCSKRTSTPGSRNGVIPMARPCCGGEDGVGVAEPASAAGAAPEGVVLDTADGYA